MLVGLDGWHSDNPPSGEVLEVWYHVTAILAVWDGNAWYTADDHRLLPGVLHWRRVSNSRR